MARKGDKNLALTFDDVAGSNTQTFERTKESNNESSGEPKSESSGVGTIISSEERLNHSSKEQTNVVKNESSNVQKNVTTEEPSNEVKRKRFSFDLRPDLQRELKLRCIMDDRNMYEVIEELIEEYLCERKNESSKER